MKKKTIVGLGALVIGSAVISPYLFGQKAELAFTSGLVGIQASRAFPDWMKVRVDRYDRGWFSSTATTTVTIDVEALYPSDDKKQPAAKPVDIVVEHHIKHGPFVGKQFAMAEVDSEIVQSDRESDIARHYFGSQSPLQHHAFISFNGVTQADFSVPAYQGRDHNDRFDINWKGLQGNVVAQMGAEQSTFNIDMPYLAVTGDKAGLTLERFNIQGHSTFNTAGAALGDITFSLQELKVSEQNEPHRKIQDLYLGFSIDQQGRLMNASNHLTFGAVDEGDKSLLQGGEASINLEHLDAAIMTEILLAIDALQKKNLPEEEFHKAVGEMVYEKTPALLKSSPVLNVERLNVSTEYGLASSKLLLSFDGSKPYDLQKTDTLLPLIHLDWQVSLPVELLKSGFEKQARKQLEQKMAIRGIKMSEAELDREVQATVLAQLGMFEMMKLIVKDKNIYKAKLIFKEGKLLLNGQPANELLGALPI